MPIFRHRDEDGTHRRRRLVRSGEMFTAAELDADEVELESVDPAAEPADPAEQDEPWALVAAVGAVIGRAREYREAHPRPADDQEAPSGDTA
jgi:hypothetical protein